MKEVLNLDGTTAVVANTANAVASRRFEFDGNGNSDLGPLRRASLELSLVFVLNGERIPK